MSIVVTSPPELAAYINQPFKCRPTYKVGITRDMIDQFISISQDQQSIHTRSIEPVAPANLLISLLPQLLQQAIKVDIFDECVTCGYTRIRFRRPVIENEFVELHGYIKKVRKYSAVQTVVVVQCYLHVGSNCVAELCVTDLYRHVQQSLS